MEKLLKSKYYTLIVALIMFVFWQICFLSYPKGNHVVSTFITTTELIECIIIGLVCFSLLTFFENMYYVIPWITYTPFVFSRPFDTQTIPIGLFIAVGLFVIGIVIHIIRFKPKLKKGSFSLGFILLALAIILGGIGTKATYLGMQILFAIPASLALLAIYILFSSNVR